MAMKLDFKMTGREARILLNFTSTGLISARPGSVGLRAGLNDLEVFAALLMP